MKLQQLIEQLENLEVDRDTEVCVMHPDLLGLGPIREVEVLEVPYAFNVAGKVTVVAIGME